MNNKRLTRIRLSLLLPAGFHTRLACYAACAGTSLSEAARRALDAGLPVLERHSVADFAEQRANLAAI